VAAAGVISPLAAVPTWALQWAAAAVHRHPAVLAVPVVVVALLAQQEQQAPAEQVVVHQPLTAQVAAAVVVATSVVVAAARKFSALLQLAEAAPPSRPLSLQASRTSKVYVLAMGR
jgi:hypothetical protein